MNPFVDDLLAGKAALITGGGTGLGRTMAETFARLGADVAVASRDPDHVEPAAAGLREHGVRAEAFTFDVRDPEGVQDVVDGVRNAFGRLDILVNNAAGNFLVRAEELSPGGWAAVRGIVLDGTWNCSRAAFEALADGGGSILNIVTTYADDAGPLVVHSAAAKAGVLSLTRTLAVEWAPRGIRVNAIAPGPVDTRGAGSRLWDSDAARQALVDSVPLGRFGTEEEIATAAAFLVCDAASYVTGACFPVDGGSGLGQGMFDPAVAAELMERAERERQG